MSANDTADEALMLRFGAGDAAAFELLYGRHRGGVYRYLLRQCGNPGTAEELAQDVWMNLIRGRAGYVASAKFATWLYRLAHNRLVDHYRSQGKVEWLSADDEEGGELVESMPAPVASQPEEQTENRHRGERLAAAIAGLPPPQREAFLLQQESGLSVEEIAAATGVSFETAKSRLRYAIGKLRAELKDLL
jgi:RNA polymerase sigma-70 factor (ECF subfamily)